jgi:hypothetical protein
MVLTASEAELLKGNANLIELLPGSDDSTLCEGSSQQYLPLTYKRLKHFVHVTSIYRLSMCHIDLELLLCCYFPMDQSNCMCCIMILCFSN